MTANKTMNDSRKRSDKPFPWRCLKCLKDEVFPQTMPYANNVKHDGRLYHIEIPQLRIPTCRVCGQRIFSNSVDDQIMQALRAHLGLLTPQQIQSERLALHLKKKQLAARLGVAAATISRWETGALIQSRAMDNYLRVYFAVPEARAVLQGADQDPKPGSGSDVVEADLPDPVVNRIQKRFPRVRDAQAASRRARAFQVAPGMS